MKTFLFSIVFLILGAFIGAWSAYLYFYSDFNENFADFMAFTHAQDSKKMLAIFDELEKRNYQIVKVELEKMLVGKHYSMKGCIEDEDFCSEYASESTIKILEEGIRMNDSWLENNSYLNKLNDDS